MAALRPVLAALALLTAGLAMSGCAGGAGGTAPTSTAAPTDGGSPSSDGGDDTDDMAAAWLDGGRMFAVVTWGSSGCVPVVESATAEGQTVTVVLADATADTVCTADWAPRASASAVPDGVDPTQDVELVVTYGDVTDDVDLDGDPRLAGTTGSTDYASSAGWADDGTVVLLTWGSSGCPPIVDAVEPTATGATVTFRDEERVCTMDMAPRATLLTVGEDTDDNGDDTAEDAFELTLVGAGLDATIPVLGG
jgi:hypothetical protein